MSSSAAGASVRTFALPVGVSLLLSLFAWVGPVSAQAVNRPPSVAVTPASVTIDGGGTVALDATASDPDNDPLTYAWSATPAVGSFANASRLDTTWTAPAAADNAHPVALTLTVSDGRGGSAIATVEAAMSGLAKLEFAVEQMLRSPYEGDPSVTVEQRHPWLRQAWDYANKTGEYAGLDYDFRVSVGDTTQTHVLFECLPGVPELSLAQCGPVSLDMEGFWVEDEYGMVTGRNVIALQTTLAHELAHVFTESSSISRNGVDDPRPDLNAIAMLYLLDSFGECLPIPPSELLADAMQVAVFPSSHGGYWYDCGYGKQMPQEAQDAVESLLSGEYPRWFTEEYGLEDDGFALRRLWRDVIASEQRIDPFYKQLWVWQLRDAFETGYCSWELAADGAYRGGPLPNPWSKADDDEAGGCYSSTGWWNALTGGRRVAALYGAAVTPAEDAAARKAYSDLDGATRRLVNATAGALYGQGGFYSVGAWWESLDSRLMQVAVGGGNEADASSRYNAHYPGSGESNLLGAEEKERVARLGQALLGLSDPGVYPPEAPGPPNAPRLTLTASDSVLVEWDPPPHDWGLPISGYVISVQQEGRGGSAKDVGSVLEHLLTGLTPGGSYKVEVWAYNAAGHGEFSPVSVIAVDDVNVAPTPTATAAPTSEPTPTTKPISTPTPATASPEEPSGGGSARWLIFLVVAGAVLLTGVVVVYVRRRRT